MALGRVHFTVSFLIGLISGCALGFAAAEIVDVVWGPARFQAEQKPEQKLPLDEIIEHNSGREMALLRATLGIIARRADGFPQNIELSDLLAFEPSHLPDEMKDRLSNQIDSLDDAEAVLFWLNLYVNSQSNPNASLMSPISMARAIDADGDGNSEYISLERDSGVYCLSFARIGSRIHVFLNNAGNVISSRTSESKQ